MAVTLSTTWQKIGSTITYRPSSVAQSSIGSLTFMFYARYQDVSGNPLQKDIQVYTYIHSPGYYRIKNDTVYQTVAGTTKTTSYTFKSPSSIYYPQNSTESEIALYSNTFRVSYNQSTGKWSGTASCYINFTFTNSGEVQGCYTYTGSDYRLGFSGNTSTMSDTIQLPDLVAATVTLSASPSDGGTVSGGGSTYVGVSKTVTATPKAAYSFYNWTSNGTAVSSNASYTFTVTGNTSLVANFRPDISSLKWYIIAGSVLKL